MKILIAVLALTLVAFAQAQHGVTLNWTPSVSPISGSNVYASTASGGPYTKVNSTLVNASTFFIPLTNTNSGIKTFFVVTALGTDGIESGWSNEVSATFLVLTQPDTALSAASQ